MLQLENYLSIPESGSENNHPFPVKNTTFSDNIFLLSSPIQKTLEGVFVGSTHKAISRVKILVLKEKFVTTF